MFSCPLPRARIGMKMEVVGAAAEVVVRTGYGEAVRVFDLGPVGGKISEGTGDHAGRTREGD